MLPIGGRSDGSLDTSLRATLRGGLGIFTCFSCVISLDKQTDFCTSTTKESVRLGRRDSILPEKAGLNVQISRTSPILLLRIVEHAASAFMGISVNLGQFA